MLTKSVLYDRDLLMVVKQQTQKKNCRIMKFYNIVRGSMSGISPEYTPKNHVVI